MESELSKIDVVVLCGGMGTRLQSAVADRPKALAQVAEQPFLDLLLGQFRRFGFRRFVLCTGYKGDMIQVYSAEFGNDVKIVISQESFPLGTAGAVKNAESLIQSDPFVVTNGDSLCSVNMGRFFEFHKSRQARMSMVLARSENPQDCGQVKIGSKGQITAFEEKQASAGPNYVSAGIYLFQKKVLSCIPPEVSCSLELELFPQLITLKNDCYGFDSHASVLDIGTPQRLEIAKRNLV